LKKKQLTTTELERRYGLMFKELRVSSFSKDLDNKVDCTEFHSEVEKIAQELLKIKDSMRIFSYNSELTH